MAKMTEKDWEGSAEDKRQDKILAKKHNESLKKWEASSADVEHDKQQSMKGLRSGGAFALRNPMKTARPKITPVGPGKVPKSFAGMSKGGGVKQSADKDSKMSGKMVPTSNQMGSLNMAKGGKVPADAKMKAAMLLGAMKDRIGRAMGAGAPPAPPPPPVDSGAPPMGAGAPPGMKKGGSAKKMAKGGSAKKMAKGGGVERKGKTSTKMVKMAKGGSIDGTAQRGRTKVSYPGMKKGGKC